ncbi:MAG: M28 family peptidase [Gemmatimonadetes bacterium]|nr:M28 family peptidase [Gemmatimonadota bacterium]
MPMPRPRGTEPMRRLLLLIPVLLAALLPAACSGTITAAADSLPRVQADSARLMRVVGALAHDSMQGRATGTPGAALARNLISQELAAAGVTPLGSGFEQPFEFSRSGVRVQAANVLGVIRGSQWPDRYIVATAHYDHLGVRNGEVYNGADDNASGTAALLELAHWFAGNRPQHSIIIAVLDGEEAGLRGARAFVEQKPVPLGDIVADINMDMVGRNASNELFAVGTCQYPQLKQYVREAARAATITLRYGHDGCVAGQEDWTWMSDQGPFLQAGIPFLYFGVEDHPDYHQPTDDVGRLMPRFFVAATQLVIDVTRRLDLTR